MNNQLNHRSELTLDEMLEQRENLRNLRLTVASRRRQLNRQHRIGVNDFNQMIAAEDLISEWIDAINDSIFDTIIVDLTNGATRLEFSINKANQAIAQLEEVNKILGYINLLIGLTQNILFVINTGDVIRIATIIDQIDSL